MERRSFNGRTKRRLALVVVLLLLAILPVMGCQQGGEVAASPSAGEASEAPASSSTASQDVQSGDLTNAINPKTGQPWRIGVAHGASVSEYLAKLGASIKESADAAGVTLEFLDADYDVNTQISQMETLITGGVDIIILNPVDASAMQNPLENAAAKNIPVICVNTKVDDPTQILCYVGSDDKEAGANIAEYACEAIGGEGGVVILEGVLGMSSEVLRSEGIDSVLPEYPNVKVLARKSANWDRQEGMTTMENWAQSFGSDIKAVIAENDEMALGAMQALEGAGLKDVVVVGVDGLQDAVLSIAEGKMSCTYLQDAEGQGSECIRAALIYLNGGEMQEEYNIPWQKITKENVSDYQ